MNGIKIKGMGFSVPEKIVTNEDLIQRIDADEDWIVSRTGIQRRHFLEKENHSDLCAKAARMALKNAGVRSDEVGACIVATFTADNLIPSAACVLQRDLGLPYECICFDVSAACAGFLFALHTIECLLASNSKKYGLVIGCETLSRVIDWEDRSTCVLFGDGAGAALVEFDKEYPSIHAVLGCSGNDQILQVNGVGREQPSLLHMQGKGVFRFALKIAPYCIEQVLKRSNLQIDDIDFFVFHQANVRIIDLVVKRYQIPAEKYYKNISEYGNTSAASIPIALAELLEQKKIQRGSRILCIGFGGGLTWGGALLEFL